MMVLAPTALAACGEFLEAGRVESRQRPDRRGDRVGRLAFAEAEFLEQQLETAAAMQLVDEAAQLVALADDLAAADCRARSRRPDPGSSAKAAARSRLSASAAPVIMARRASAISDCSICWSSISK